MAFRVCLQVRFMLETLLALKNNDVRKIPGYDPEPLERLRKLQRALVGTLLPGRLRCWVCANPRDVPEGGGATGQVPARLAGVPRRERQLHVSVGRPSL